MNSILADVKLINGTTLRRLFDPNPETNREGYVCRGLWNGVDGMAPPPFGGVGFPSNTTHYLTSGQAAIDSGDVDDMAAALRAKGYGLAPGSRLLLLCNATESKAVQTWRAGVVTANGVTASHDFIPSASALVPPFLTDQTVEGTRAEATYGGLGSPVMMRRYSFSNSESNSPGNSESIFSS